ncbi:methyltransferase domain-containing protein [Candidatus Saganbacteria bacterium]|nr:methyltransferase domain-containing protein [Candidatus Saganbacteria bacterium]
MKDVKKQIKENFSKSSKNYDKISTFQKSLANKLFQKTKGIKGTEILDLGCGTGYLVRKLANKYINAKIVGIDIAPGMIKEAKNREPRRLVSGFPNNIRYLVQDCEELPKLGAFDLIVSNASLQWMDLKKVSICVEMNLKPNGVFMFNTMGPNNLKELKDAGFRKNDCPSISEIKNIFGGNFKKIRIAKYEVKQKFKDIKALIKYLKDIGANTPTMADNPNINRSRSTLKKSSAPFYTTFEVIFGAFRL